ncbi:MULTISPECIES: ribonuclease domain-containing protein [Methylotuvimicrobium]|uniref:Ribonuclease T(1) n=2 Tax=Methylotuvimicrobium TaxID=2822410 RepID=G4SU63_META2|nr:MULTISPECIES: ribonuclease domain-containing protein [Methylotuvimicrobium]QCW82991.1 ribonuclease [Methylotuvimicrobium buryatense]CCE23969.1 putative Ribonuclease T(1) [Methylotuvimicrobium alcaliphilum 20Z]
MRGFPRWLILVALIVGLAQWWNFDTSIIDEAKTIIGSTEGSTKHDTETAFLPKEAYLTIRRIQQGGPHPYPQDDKTFFNRERHLPQKPRGYYREYTVDTPGLSHRGARRIVTGGQPPQVWYYTDDHYNSFRAFPVPQ